jgi:hypothetical protein
MKISITTIGFMAILNVAVSTAQITSTSAEFNTKKNAGDTVEYVTAGSVMPYKVTPYDWGSLSSFMNPSIFKWWLNGNATGYALLKKDGVTPLTLLPAPNHDYYPDSAISIQWIKTGAYTIRVSEKSIPKPGITSCDKPGDFQTLDVVVANRPTIAWDGATLKGGCSLDGTTQNLPVIVTGSKQVTITYAIIYTPQKGPADTTRNQSKTFMVPKNVASINDTIHIPIPKGNYGKYEIAITGIADKISVKCGIPAQASDYPSNKYTIAVLPALETGEIEFVKEL